MFLIITPQVITSALPSNIDVNIKTNTNSPKVDEEFYIYLTSSNIKDLFSLSFDLKFNTDILDIISIEKGSFFENEPVEFKSNFNSNGENSKTLSSYTTFTGGHKGKTSSSESELIKLKAKLLKECKIPFGIINNKNNLFVGNPNIRLVMIDSNLKQLDISNSIDYIQSKNFSSDKDISLFINNVYKKTFSRDPEEEGFKYWYNKLISQEYSVRNFLINILNEEEFINKNLSNENFIISMYSIIANRDPDEKGYNYWLNLFENYLKELNEKEAKSKIILRICNEAELKERSLQINLKF